MDHFLFNTPRLLVGTKGDLRNDVKRISELNANGQQLISVEQVKKSRTHNFITMNSSSPPLFIKTKKKRLKD